MPTSADPVPVWTTVFVMLLGFKARSGVAIERIAALSDISELAFTLCDQFAQTEATYLRNLADALHFLYAAA